MLFFFKCWIRFSSLSSISLSFVIIFNSYYLLFRYRTKSIIAAQGGRIPLSFDYVLSIQHSEERIDETVAAGVSVFGFANVANGLNAATENERGGEEAEEVADVKG